jgi:HEPN domain-containing protein
MPYDPVLVADTKAWMAKAASDLRAGAHELTASPPFTGDAVFHAQQAAEKALKGLLVWHDVPFRKTHDLTEVGQACVEIDASLAPLLRSAAELTQYVWRYRYPGESGEPTMTEAEEALALARRVYEAILTRLPQEVTP